jgi:hypothetical protein
MNETEYQISILRALSSGHALPVAAIVTTRRRASNSVAGSTKINAQLQRDNLE